MKTVLRYLIPFRTRMAVGFLIKVFGTVVELFIPWILSYILKDVVGSQDWREILNWGSLMILCAGAACVFNIVANRMAARVSRDFSERMRRELFAHTMRLSAAQTDRFTIPSLESRITTDTYHVHHFIGMVQRMGVRAPILLIGGIVVTMFLDPVLSLVMLAVMPLIFTGVYFVSRKGVPLYARVQTSVDGMVRVVREDVQGIRVIKALSKNEYENRRYDRFNAQLSRDERRAGIVMGIANPVMTLLMNCGITAVVAISADTFFGHDSDPETVIAFMQYFTLISMAMMAMSRMFVMYTKCAASARRIAEVIETPAEIVTCGAEMLDPAPAIDPGAHISFEHVGFSYTGGHEHLKDVHFSLPRGATLGVIGSTGSGKSTLIRLLLRFYDVGRGRILIDGKDIRTIEKDALASMFGVALQNDFLYADTILENVKFGRDLSPEQLDRAAEIAQAREFIESFPDGWEYPLASKATNLSGGQKQRLLITRAIAASPEILILDDSSSALDYKTDANLRRALREEMKDTTVITVAQRVSSVMHCDLILVLENGEVIGQGKHEELLESCAPYREISDSQMGGAFVE